MYIKMQDGRRQDYVWVVLKVNTVDEQGRPEECTVITDDRMVELAGGEEFVTALVPRVVMERTHRPANQGPGAPVPTFPPDTGQPPPAGADGSEPEYHRDDGTQTTVDDPKRLLWHSATCTFWTDDWSLLALAGPGIPCCPDCESPGYQTTAEKWDEGVSAADKQRPGYMRLVHRWKGICRGHGVLFSKLADQELGPSGGTE